MAAEHGYGIKSASGRLVLPSSIACSVARRTCRFALSLHTNARRAHRDPDNEIESRRRSQCFDLSTDFFSMCRNPTTTSANLRSRVVDVILDVHFLPAGAERTNVSPRMGYADADMRRLVGIDAECSTSTLPAGTSATEPGPPPTPPHFGAVHANVM